jgi:glutaconate CoA-transferase subunit A
VHVLEHGGGELFTNPDPDEARRHFRSKDKSLRNKVMRVDVAVRRFVHDGDYLAIGGFGTNRIPTAICHEILRQGRKHLGFLGHTATHDFQILAAGEAFDRCDVAYVVGLEARGLSRRYVESGRVRVTENSNYTLSARLEAAAKGVPFAVSRNLLGTETFDKSASKVVECPFTGKRVVAHPAIYPDVAAIHVHEADVYGNSRIEGITVSDLELARAAKHLVITTEKLIHTSEIRRDPSATSIPYYLVDAVCEVPWGSYPGNMPGIYFSDEEHLRDWLAAEQSPETFRAFLERYIYGVAEFSDYLALRGAPHRLRELRRKELLLRAPEVDDA